MKAIRHILDSARSDGVQILEAMNHALRQRRSTPFIRETAVRLLHGVGDHDRPAQIRRLLDFVKEKVIYVRDPVGSEYITDPVNLLHDIFTRGEARGDCDDHSMILAALLQSVGIETRFLAVKVPPADVWNHVIVAANDGKEWTAIDPCAKQRPMRIYNQVMTVHPDTQKVQMRTSNLNQFPLEAFADFDVEASAPLASVGARIQEFGIGVDGIVNAATNIANAAANVIGAVKGGGTVQVQAPQPSPGQPVFSFAPGQGQGAAPPQSGGINNQTLILAGVGLLAFMAFRK